MCTAIFDRKYGAFFGRTLDLECSHGERVMRVSRGEGLDFIHHGRLACRHSILGMAYDTMAQPLFYDGVNDAGLCAAALNFPKFAKYCDEGCGRVTLASFEVISYLLAQCADVSEVKSALDGAAVTREDFSPELRSTPLHWMFADSHSAIVVEAVGGGLTIYDNPFGVMTNSPPFPYHAARLCEFSYLSPEPQENRLLPNQALLPYSRGLGAYGLPGDYSSSSRFVRAVFAREHTLLYPCGGDTCAAERRMFDILCTVSLPYGIARTDSGEAIYTVYTSCIDMARGVYSCFTYQNREIKRFKF